jgi:CheY-like chemotaxis protein
MTEACHCSPAGRAAFSDTPRLVALSGYGSEQHRALEAGFDTHIAKPMAAAQLHRELAAVVARQR